MVDEVRPGKDGLVRNVLVSYKNYRYISSIAPAGSPQGLRSVFPMEEGTV